jgi:hypothetical protein
MSQIKNVNQHELSGLVSFSFKYLKKTDKYDYTKASNEDTLVGDNAWQFSISANVYGRIIGFIIGNIFCIVWIDIEHLTYPKK